MQVETVTTAPQTTQKVAKAKHWAGCTLNNYTPQDEAKFLANIQPLADYYVYGKEVAPSGTPHLQFMVCFKKQTSSVAVQKLLKAAWFVKSSKSTMQQASDYCKKGGDFFEIGVLGEGDAIFRWQDVRKNAAEGNFDQIPDSVFVPYYNNIHRIFADAAPPVARLTEYPGVWIWGPPGTGKSRKAREDWADGLYVKNQNKWFDGFDVRVHKNVLIDDADPVHCKTMAYYFKTWLDIYPFKPEIKGGHLSLIRPVKFIITSNYSIEECFDPTDAAAVRRRCHVIHMTTPFAPEQ